MRSFRDNYWLIALGSSVATNDRIFTWMNHRPGKRIRASMLNFLMRIRQRLLLVSPIVCLYNIKSILSNLNKVSLSCHGNFAAHKLFKTLENCFVFWLERLLPKTPFIDIKRDPHLWILILVEGQWEGYPRQENYIICWQQHTPVITIWKLSHICKSRI